MQTVSSVFQVTGLACLIVGAVLEFGVAGGVAASGVASMFVGLALERES